MTCQRLLTEKLSRNRPFCLLGAAGTGKTTLIREFAGKFSNFIHLDLDTAVDRAIFDFESSAMETLKAVGFLKGRELRGKGTLIVLDEIGKCSGAARWVGELMGVGAGDWTDGRTGGQADGRTSGQGDKRTGGQGDGRAGGQVDGPFIVATSSVLTKQLGALISLENGLMDPVYLHPFSFEEFLMAMDDNQALEAFREVPVPYYAYEKLLNYFHLYTLIGGMPEIISDYAATRHLAQLKKIYERASDRFIHGIDILSSSAKSSNLAADVLQNTYPFAATRISYNHFGNLEKGSREINQAFKTLESAFLLHLVYPIVSANLPLTPDFSRFPRLHMLDTGLVNYFSGIQKPLFQSHDMNAIFEGQIARQVVGQEILVSENQDGPDRDPLKFWVRSKIQGKAEVDFVIRHGDLLIPVVVKSGEPGRLRSLHQYIDSAPHAYAVRLYAGKVAVQQCQTISGKKYYLLNLPYFLAGKIKDHLRGFIRLTDGN